MNEKLSKKDIQALACLNRETVLRFTACTIVNIADLRNAALLLFRNGQYGVSKSLAIFANEELGKLVISIFYLIGQMKPEQFIKNIRSHSQKQAYGTLWTKITSFIDLKEPDIKKAFSIDAVKFADGIKLLTGNIDSVMDRIEQPITSQSQLIADEFSTVQEGVKEISRQNGLYVSLDIKDDTLKVQDPRSVTQEEALSELNGIEQFMRMVDDTDEIWKIAELEMSYPHL